MKTITIKIDSKGKPNPYNCKVHLGSEVVFDCDFDFTITPDERKLFSHKSLSSTASQGKYKEKATARVGSNLTLHKKYYYNINLPSQSDFIVEDTPPTIIIVEPGPKSGFIHFIWRQIRRFLAYLKGLRFFR